MPLAGSSKTGAHWASPREAITVHLEGGEVIEEYPDDTPFPSALILGFVSSGPLHVVAALDASGPDPYIITVYRPSPDKFEPDWKTRRKR